MSESKEVPLRMRSPTLQIRMKAEAGLPGLPAEWVEWSLRGLRPVAVRIASSSLLPDHVSLFSGLTALAAASALFKGWNGTAFFLSLFSGVADLLDGWVARLQSRSSARGEILDASVDRIADFSFLFALALRFQHQAEWLVPLWLAQFGGATITHLSAKADWAGVESPGGWFRRPGRTFLLLTGLLASALWDPVDCFPLWLGVWGVALGSCVSGGLRFQWLRKELGKPRAAFTGRSTLAVDAAIRSGVVSE